MGLGWHRVMSQQDYQGSCLFPRRRKGQDPFQCAWRRTSLMGEKALICSSSGKDIAKRPSVFVNSFDITFYPITMGKKRLLPKQQPFQRSHYLQLRNFDYTFLNCDRISFFVWRSIFHVRDVHHDWVVSTCIFVCVTIYSILRNCKCEVKGVR